MPSGSPEEQDCQQPEERHEDEAGPRHVAEEARHPDAPLLTDRLDHEVRRIADVAVRPHENGPGRYGGESGSQGAHQEPWISAGEVEEDQIGRSIVEEARKAPREPEI